MSTCFHNARQRVSEFPGNVRAQSIDVSLIPGMSTFSGNLAKGELKDLISTAKGIYFALYADSGGPFRADGSKAEGHKGIVPLKASSLLT